MRGTRISIASAAWFCAALAHAAPADYFPLQAGNQWVYRAATGSETWSVAVTGVDTNSNVMCLTCHRAHASANDNAGRWAFNTEFLAETPALISTDVDTTTAAVYYKAGTNGMALNDIVGQYGEWQRSLCNKCHGWD